MSYTYDVAGAYNEFVDDEYEYDDHVYKTKQPTQREHRHQQVKLVKRPQPIKRHFDAEYQMMPYIPQWPSMDTMVIIFITILIVVSLISMFKSRNQIRYRYIFLPAKQETPSISMQESESES